MLLTYPDNILVMNKCQGTQGKYKIQWDPAILAESYNIYWNYVPYGSFMFLANTTDTYYIHSDFSVIDGTYCYYKVSAVRNGKESELSRPQTAQNTSEYINNSTGTWIDTNNMLFDPHTNKYPTSNNKTYKGVNYLPLNVLRRYQFNKIQRDEMWILQDRGELVWLIKQKRTNYSQPDDDDARRIGNSEIVEYYEPIKICVALASPNQTHTIIKGGMVLEKNTRSWTIYTPRIDDNDIIIDKENNRWQVQNVTRQKSFRGSVTWQQFDIIQVGINSPIYNNEKIRNVDGLQLYPQKWSLIMDAKETFDMINGFKKQDNLTNDALFISTNNQLQEAIAISFSDLKALISNNEQQLNFVVGTPKDNYDGNKKIFDIGVDLSNRIYKVFVGLLMKENSEGELDGDYSYNNGIITFNEDLEIGQNVTIYYI